MRERLDRLRGKDLRLWQLLAAGAVLVAVRLILCSAQQVFLYPDESGMDDMLMYNMARSIVAGEWLGPYNWLTLAKYSFFALWLAVLHILGIPYLLGGQLLWTLACSLSAWAMAPLLRRKWVALALFAALLYNPASIANPAPYGYIARVYRDNIFPSLCLLCICGMVGFALRCKQPLKRSVGWLVVCGLGLAACWLTREDGMWVLPFVVAGALACAVFLLTGKEKPKPSSCLCLLLPFLLLGGALAGWSAMNYKYYGRFIVSDFTGHEFAEAYGALTRINPDVWELEYAVPESVRQELYLLSPTFAELEEYLEHPATRERFGNHRSGGFYWALREAAAHHGYYETPETAKAYFYRLASEINSLVDAGLVKAGPKRKSVTPPLDRRFVPMVAKEWGQNLWYCATFQGSDARSLVSIGEYERQLAPMEEFLHEDVLLAYQENSDQPYYSRPQRLIFAALDIIAFAYRVAVPLALAAALFWQVASAVQIGRGLRRKENRASDIFVWTICLGLLFMILLRSAMIAFTSVSSFQIGIYIMYLASVHPLMILYGFTGTFLLLRWLLNRKAAPPMAADTQA